MPHPLQNLLSVEFLMMDDLTLPRAPGWGGESMARSRKASVDCRSTAEKNEEEKRGSSRWTSQS